MTEKLERTKKDRILLDMKEIKKKVRRSGFRDTMIEESKIRKKPKHQDDEYFDEEDCE